MQKPIICSGDTGEPEHIPSEVVDPKHASIFMMRNLGYPKQSPVLSKGVALIETVWSKLKCVLEVGRDHSIEEVNEQNR